MKVGIYFCSCGTSISERISSARLMESLHGHTEAVYLEAIDFMCSEEGKAALESNLRDNAPDRVVIAACSPRDHEPTFRRVLASAGVNPYLMQMVNIREQVAWVTPDPARATEKAARLIRGAVARIRLHQPLDRQELDVCPEVLVVGAGPAGLKAAFTLAEAGRRVTVVEKSPVLGGLPVRFEEIAPTMECGSCMLEPLLGEILHGEHSGRIEIRTLAEVVDVVGFHGRFTARIRQSPRYVSSELCVGCGECIPVCPVSATNEFNCGLNERKAIDVPFPGALPNVPSLDAHTCIRFRGEDCQACKAACPVGESVIDHAQAAQMIEREVGAIVVAIGASLYDCRKLPDLGYGRIGGVLTALDFERILASNGPTAGLLQLAGHESPDAVAIIHCVGSLDVRRNDYCSAVCCQYAFKFNHMIETKLPGTKVLHLYKEIAVPGKHESSILHRARANPNAAFVRYGDIQDIRVSDSAGNPNVAYRDTTGSLGSFDADIVVLCPAVVPSDSAANLAATMDTNCDRFGFFEELHDRLDAGRSTVRGIYLAGACQSPMDIQHAMSQGAAAAGYILSGLVEGKKLYVEPITASIDAERCSGCRVCGKVCPYKAISFDADKEVSVVNAVLCQGCGTCVAACPAGVIEGQFFTDRAICAELAGVLE
ncbi:MAG: CoB--CoM heterodisulfide reductase iron-sulfur subunit A family protein [Acidobacteriota bacterium]